MSKKLKGVKHSEIISRKYTHVSLRLEFRYKLTLDSLDEFVELCEQFSKGKAKNCIKDELDYTEGWVQHKRTGTWICAKYDSKNKVIVTVLPLPKHASPAEDAAEIDLLKEELGKVKREKEEFVYLLQQYKNGQSVQDASASVVYTGDTSIHNKALNIAWYRKQMAQLFHMLDRNEIQEAKFIAEFASSLPKSKNPGSSYYIPPDEGLPLPSFGRGESVVELLEQRTSLLTENSKLKLQFQSYKDMQLGNTASNGYKEQSKLEMDIMDYLQLIEKYGESFATNMYNELLNKAKSQYGAGHFVHSDILRAAFCQRAACWDEALAVYKKIQEMKPLPHYPVGQLKQD